MVNNNFTAIVIVAVVVALVASFATASIVGNTIRINPDKFGGYQVYIKAEIDKRLANLATKEDLNILNSNKNITIDKLNVNFINISSKIDDTTYLGYFNPSLLSLGSFTDFSSSRAFIGTDQISLGHKTSSISDDLVLNPRYIAVYNDTSGHYTEISANYIKMTSKNGHKFKCGPSDQGDWQCILD